MASLNKVLAIGNLTKDPELRYTPQGVAVVNLRIAVNRRWKDKTTGEQRDEACFFTIVVWDKQAEVCNQYLRKGSPIFVEGRLQSRSWEDNTGQKRNVLEVRAERVQFLGQGSGAQAAKPAVSNQGITADISNNTVSQEEDTSWVEGEEKSVNE